MSLVQASHDSLPYIDPDISSSERALAVHAIEAELAADHQTTSHPTLRPLPEPHFSKVIEHELTRLGTTTVSLPSEPGIDITRYEALDPPPPPNPTSNEDPQPEVLDAWRSTLRKAYTSSSHLETRLTNLALLEQFGKNAWLIGNAQLEDVLKAIETELVETRARTELVNKERKMAQVSAQPELDALAHTWRQRLARVLETEVAAETLRREILQRRRELVETESRP